MTDPPVQNLSSRNDSEALHSFFICTDHHTALQFWLCCYCICFILGFPASLMALRELFRRHRQGTCNGIFMLNLHLADLIFITMILPSIFNILVLKSVTLYQLISFIHALPMCGRPLFMACICGDCYFAVVHPILYKTSKHVSMIRNIISLMVWLVIFCFGVILACVNHIFTSPFACAPLTMALPVITFCDISILCSLQKPDPSGNKTIHPQKKQALYTIFSSLIMTFVSYLPPVIIFLFAEALPMSKHMFFCNLAFTGICFYVVGCVTMSLLYLYSVGKMDCFKLCSHVQE